VSVEPNACGWCGVSDREHLQRWTKGAGWHVWSAPTQEQRKERMLARAAERRPTTAPDTAMDEFEAADDTERFEYVRDELTKAKALIDETKALIDEYSAPASGMPHTPAQGDEDGDSLAELTASIAEYVRACKAAGCSCHPIASNTKVISHWCRNHGVLSVVPAELTWSNPGIRGGEPCMLNTRVPVEQVSTLLEDGATWEQVKDIYPSIPTPEATREAAQPGAGDAETSGMGSGRGTGEPRLQISTQGIDGEPLTGPEIISRTLVLAFGTRLHERPFIREIADALDNALRPVHEASAPDVDGWTLHARPGGLQVSHDTDADMPVLLHDQHLPLGAVLAFIADLDEEAGR
jgi:hypothetical protein